MANDAKKWLLRKQSVWSKYNGKCAYCGCDISIGKFQIDHIVSKSHYQQHARHYIEQGFNVESIDNLNPSCCSCNNYKRDFTLEGFREQIESQIDRLRRDKPTFRMAERFGLIQCIPKKVKFYFEDHG